MADVENALTRYLRDTGINLSGLAAAMGKSPSTLTRPLKGERNPSVGLAREVERATDGRVTASEFIDVCIRARAAEQAGAA